DDPERYFESMRDILYGEEVRFHLKHLALQILGHAETPTDDEVGLVLGLLERPEWVAHVCLQVLAGRESWFDALHQRGILRSWLDSTDERRVKLAIDVIERVVKTRGSVIESLLLDRGRDKWPGRLALAVWRTSPELLTEGLFNAVLDLKRRG